MAATPSHGDLDPDVQGVHVPFQYSFADATSRTGAPASMLLGGASKLALQRDNMSLWLLTSVSPTPTWQQIGGSNLATGGSNIGSGIGIYSATSGQNLEFRSILGGPGVNVSLQSNTSSVVVTASAPSATNLGTGASLYRETTASLMQFKTLLPGTGINLSADASTITIEASAVSGGGASTERIYIPANGFVTTDGASYSYNPSLTHLFGWGLADGASQSVTTTFLAKRTIASPTIDIFWATQSSAGSMSLSVSMAKPYVYNDAYPYADNGLLTISDTAASNSINGPTKKITASGFLESGMFDVMPIIENTVYSLRIRRNDSGSADTIDQSVFIKGVSIY